MDQRFRDKTAIVTGASSGIGAVTAKRFWQEGANVVLVARTEQALRAVASEMDPQRTLVVPADLAQASVAGMILEMAHSRFGAVHVLVNNAVLHVRGNLEDLSPADLACMVRVGLEAPIVLSRVALPYLLDAGNGAIVNVGSVAGRTTIAGVAAYCTVKAGLRAFSLSLAGELRGSGVTVSIVEPGPVRTERVIRDLDRIPDLVFCIPVVAPEAVAEAVLACAHDGRPVRTVPCLAGWLIAMGAWMPGLRRLLTPVLIRIGRSKKARVR